MKLTYELDGKGGLRALADHRLLWNYQYNHFDYHPHFHPIRLLQHRNPVIATNNMPGDHPWHQGVMFAWKNINGYNVWDMPEDKPSGAARHIHLEVEHHSDTRLRFRQQLEIVSNDTNPQILLNEDRSVDFHFDPDSHKQIYDWTIETVAPEQDVAIEGDPNHGGYGGFCFRGCALINDAYAHSGGSEFLPPDNDFARYQVAYDQKWVAITMLMDGIERGVPIPDRYVTACILDHPENLSHPTPVLAWPHMQKLNMGILNRRTVSIKRGESLQLKYRLTLQPGVLDPDQMNSSYQEYKSANTKSNG